MSKTGIFVGIDGGSQTTKVVVTAGGKVLAKKFAYTDFDAKDAASAALSEALAEAGLGMDDVAAIAATGTNRQLIDFANSYVNEIVADAAGVHHVLPGMSMILDMGAEGSRAIDLDENGAAKTYEINDRCASGAGTFIETCARALEITPADMGELSLNYTKDIPMKAQCVVFVESEVISLIHQKESKENIARGVLMGINTRLGSMFRRLGIREGIAFVGWPANNVGLVKCLEEDLGQKITVPEDPEYICALGAALCAEKAAKKKEAEA